MVFIFNKLKANKERILQQSARASSISSIITGILSLSGVIVPISIPIGLGLNIILFSILCMVEFSGETIDAFKRRFEDKFSDKLASENEIIILYDLRNKIDQIIVSSECGSTHTPFP